MTVEVEDRENGVRIIRLAGASASKSFSRESMPIIARAIDDGLSKQSVRALIITGEGKFFSAGADIHAFQEAIDADDAPQLIRDLTSILHPLLVRMRQSATIVVGAINERLLVAASDSHWRAMSALDHQKPSLLPPMPAWVFHLTVAQPGCCLDLSVNSEAAPSSLKIKFGRLSKHSMPEPSMRSLRQMNSSTGRSRSPQTGANGAIISEKQPSICFMCNHRMISRHT